jgi:hypothetical protein
VWRLSGEFFEYAAAADFAGRWGYPFLTDLLLMEWTETEVYNMPDAAWPAFTLEGDWLQDPVVVTPELRLVPLSYPVHIQPAGEITAGDEDQYFLLAFRQRPACKVQFLSISPLHVFLLEQLGQAPQSVAALTALAEAQLGLEQAQLQAPAIDFLQRLQQKGCVLGFAPTSETVG